MSVEAQMGFSLIASIALAVYAIIKNSTISKQYGRRDFTIVCVLVAAPVMLIVVPDIAILARLLYPDLDMPELNALRHMVHLLPIYFLVIAYPFFQRICWRANDACAHKVFCYLGLVPYLNVLVFAYLCIKPTSNKDTIT